MMPDTLNVNDIRSYLDGACAWKTEMMACVRYMTKTCTKGDFLRNEAEAALSVCDESGWVYKYALPGLSDGNRECLYPYYSQCMAVFDGFRSVNETATLDEGMNIMKTNMERYFKCFLDAARNDGDANCSPVWQDSFFYTILPLLKERDLGIRLYPDQIAQLPALAASRNEN